MNVRPSARARAAQWLLPPAIALLGWVMWSNAARNLARRNTGFGFGFLSEAANFDIPFHLLGWTVGDSYARALLVCTANTLFVSAVAIVAATLLGLVVGILRLSTNWLARNLALVFIEVFRNTPQLVQIVFWYIAVLQTLPGPRASIVLPGGALLNIRGLYLPLPDISSRAAVAAALCLVATPVVWRWIGRRALALPVLAIAVLVIGTSAIETPAMAGFNIVGGTQIPPELVALALGLSMYSAAFIAEIVRAAILAVPAGQREAALSLGLRPAQVLAKVVIPQALRIMVPPLTSQYLNLIKSSSLGAAIAYPELFQIFAGTVLNQTGREIETILLLMLIFLGISLATSAFMNWYNRRVALVTR